jgi:hypothetical protein
MKAVPGVMILSVVLAVSRHEGQQPQQDEVVSSSLFEQPRACLNQTRWQDPSQLIGVLDRR